ncbi:MAG: nuclear transport factor 2 family protein [Acidobacteriota bacterium]|nr:nuclear transport factor 2 family protein [Acidobacteriota bacterium]
MTRFAVLFPALFLSCAAFAQNPAPATALAQPAATSAASSEVAVFQKIEDTWSNAINMRDQYSLELVISPLFVDVSAAGDITTRNQQLANLISGDDKTIHLEQRVITVRMLGDIAVANGTYALHHKVGSAQVDEKGVFTHVFERVRGGWMCINSQRTVVPEDPKAKAKKSSGSDSPFHIPLFSRGDKKDQ